MGEEMAPRRILLLVLPLLLLAATILATTAAWRYERDQSQRSAGIEAERAAAALQVSLASAATRVESVAGLFDASSQVTETDFRVFARRLVGGDGLRAVTWLERVPRARRAAYERRTGRPILTPARSGPPVVAPARPVSYPVTFTAVWGGLPVTPGLDVGANPSRRASLAAAVRSGEPQATPPVTLLSSANRGIIIYEAVYDHGAATGSPAGRLAALRGYVSGIYLLDTLFGETASQLPGQSHWQVTQGSAVVQDSDVGAVPPDADAGEPLTGAVESFTFAGRRWSVAVAARGTDWGAPLTFLLSGAAITMLALALTLAMGRRDRFARRAVVAATRELTAGEERYRSLVSTMSDGVILVGPSGEIVECNPAAEEILGLSPSQMEDRDPTDPRWRTVHEDGTPMPREERPSHVTLRTGRPVHGAVMGIHRPDGRLAWISVSTSILEGDAPGEPTVVACLTDITIRLRAEREHAALRRVATLVAGEAPPSAVFGLVAREAAALVAADAAEVVRFAVDDSGAVTEGAWIREGRPAVATPTRLALGVETASGLVAATGASARIVHDDSTGSNGDPGAGTPHQWAAAAPITVGDRLWGTIVVSSVRNEPFPAGAEEQLELFGELLTLAIVSADAHSQLDRLASTDHLTGLWNRRAFEEHLGVEVERAIRYSHPMSLLVIDLDHFKRVNDTHGHPAGDRVLVEVAERLRATARRGEIVARVGGEEFAWILPATGSEGALNAAGRLRAAINDEPFREVGSLTVSAGVCDLSLAPNAAELFRLADVALYRAKSEGRDRAVGYRADMPALLRPDR
jgi:diguanylate cyclase (GGDEF)-like protein/PAS domain S-box-containing protein